MNTMKKAVCFAAVALFAVWCAIPSKAEREAHFAKLEAYMASPEYKAAEKAALDRWENMRCVKCGKKHEF